MLTRIYNWLFRACRHEWETMHRIEVMSPRGGEIPIGYDVELRCKHCGDWKVRRL